MARSSSADLKVPSSLAALAQGMFCAPGMWPPRVRALLRVVDHVDQLAGVFIGGAHVHQAGRRRRCSSVFDLVAEGADGGFGLLGGVGGGGELRHVLGVARGPRPPTWRGRRS